ncbi:hypothetical protein C8R44DRAFT_832893 [Mycena epipterygia]|nr:hypothetical protein C8R44DRAFT_832893 [Mycena epipterygia]
MQEHECSGKCVGVVSIFAKTDVDRSKTIQKTVKVSHELRKGTKKKNSVHTLARKTYEELTRIETARKLRASRKKWTGRLLNPVFPPRPLTTQQTFGILRRHCKTLRPASFVEGGCAVCGSLVARKFLTPLALLIRAGVTRKERFKPTDRIEELEGPVLAAGCTHICVDCETSLDNGVVPKTALVRHNWLGEVPKVLQDLSYAEGIMIARVRHNRCVVRVNSGRVRMSANAIMFSQPILSIYNELPPSKDEMSEILAFVFTGSAAPTQEDFDRTPMLVRKKKVVDALEWLKLNHEGYADLEISLENLASYADRDIPVVVDWRRTKEEIHDSVPAGTTAANETPREHGTRSGKCTFAVHGLTGTEYATATMKTIKSVALQHLTHKGSMLGIGRSELPVTYPGMFPWLFPYGKGGIGHPSHTNKTGDLTRKRCLLMYHDKRFQMDTYFPMIAFNHEQLKAASTGSFLLAKRAKFDGIARRLSAVNPEVAGQIADRLSAGEHLCFDLIKDLDGVSGRVMGSIWSSTAFFNAPNWFVTVSWSDVHHPLALYYAQEDTNSKVV